MEIEPSVPAGDVEIEWAGAAGEEEDVMLDVEDSGMEGDAEMGDDATAGDTSGIVDAVLGGEHEHHWAGAGDDEELPDAAASPPQPALAEDVPFSEPSSPLVAPPPAATVAPIDHPGFESPPLILTSSDALQTSTLGHSAADSASAPTTFFATPASPTVTPLATSATARTPAPFPTPTPHLTNGSAAHSPSHPADPSSGPEDPPTTAETNGDAPAPSSAPENGDAAPQSHSGHLDRSKALASQSQHSSDRSLSQEQVVETTGDHETVITQRQSQDVASGDQAVQENEVVVHQETDSESGKERVEIEMNQTNSSEENSDGGGGRQGPQQVNHVKVFQRGEDCASCTHSGGTMSRPAISKDFLAVVDLDPLFEPTTPTVTGDDVEEAEDDDAPPRLIAPTVLLSLNGKTYSVFQRLIDIDADHPLDATLPVLFEEPTSHELYYDQLESFIEALHDVFPELSSRQDEIVLSFEAIGITLPEDNVYTREVCIFDFDRVHVGCGLPGRLHITLETQARFSTGFNALAQHIANTYVPIEDPYLDDSFGVPEPDAIVTAADEEPTEERSEHAAVEFEEAEPTATAAEGEGGEGGEAGEDPTAHFEDGEWAPGAADENEGAYDDATAAVTEFEGGEEPAATEDDAEAGEAREEEHYEALDDADLAAAIEGVQEDYMLADTTVEVEGEGEGEEYVDAEFGEPEEAEDEATTAGEGSGDVPATRDDDDEPSAEPDAEASNVDEEAGEEELAPPEISIDSSGSVAEDDGADEEEVTDDLVIDYEEVFDTSAVPSPAAAAPPADEAPTSPSPKRSHDDLQIQQVLDGEAPPDEDVSSAAKRARIDERTFSPPPEPTPSS